MLCLHCSELRAVQTNAICVLKCQSGNNLLPSFFFFLQEVEQEFCLPVVSIVQLQHLIAYVKDQSAAAAVPVSDGGDKGDGGVSGVCGVSLEDIEAYRKQYGVEY